MTSAPAKPKLAIAANACPKIGGQGLNLYHMAEALRSDFDVSVFCREDYPGLSTTVIPRHKTVERLFKLPFVGRFRNWQNWHDNESFDRDVANRLEKLQVFHGAVGQSLHSFQNARKQGSRTVLDVVTLHVDVFATAQGECAQFGIRPPLHHWERERILKEYIEADLIRVMSNVAQHSFVERGVPIEKLVVASPPFQVDEFPEAKFEEPVFRVCYVGLIEPWKGFHYLIEAFERLRMPDTELVLWGGCGTRAVTRYMQQKLALNSNIALRPVAIRTAGLENVYAKSSVLVLPSLADGFGYVVGEAMACGVPVIVTSNTGAADLVLEGINGFIVPPGDTEAIAERLHHLAQSPSLVKAMGKAAREAMRKRRNTQMARDYANRVRALI